MLAACPSIYRTIIPHSVDRLDGAEWCKGKIQGFTLLYIFLTVISHVTLMCHVQYDSGYCNNMEFYMSDGKSDSTTVSGMLLYVCLPLGITKIGQVDGKLQGFE